MAAWIFTLDTISTTAADFWRQFGGRRVFAFHGQMGTGKTTVIHAICDVLKIDGVMGSPTFSIINEYGSAGGIIYHMDLYRLQGEEEVIRTGVEDCFYSGHTCLVEWPERAPGIFPPDTVHVYLEAIDEQTRRLRVEDK
jgi:tRNA threonylcarbamoyladenosine biosynthesis protein TsaE